MEYAQLLFFVVTLLVTVTSLVRYVLRRQDSKGALRTLQERSEPLRALGSAERDALQPFLQAGGMARRPATLWRDGVFELRGPFLRHGLTTTGGGETLHSTIGGVEVTLPFDAAQHLRDDNVAEVVVTQTFAIVVRLNGTFDLLQARARTQDEQQANAAWTAGVVDAPPSRRASASRQTDDGEVRILGQRDETVAEMTDRLGPGFGIAAACTLLAGTVLTLVGLSPQTTMTWSGAIVCAGSLLLALFVFFLRGGRLLRARPKRVNIAEGPLRYAVGLHADGSAAPRMSIHLGDRIPLAIPPHWQRALAAQGDDPVRVEMRVDDFSVVRLGQRRSIDDDIRASLPVPSLRHITLAVVSALLLIGVGIAQNSQLRHDLRRTWAWITVPTPLRIDGRTPVTVTDLVPGRVVEVSGPSWCAIADTVGFMGRLPPVTCAERRFGGRAPAVVALTVSPQLDSLADGTFLRAESDPVLDVMIAGATARSGGIDAYAATPRTRDPAISVVLIRSLTPVVATIDSLCPTMRAGPSDGPMSPSVAVGLCDDLTSAFAARVSMFDGEAKQQTRTWREVLERTTMSPRPSPTLYGVVSGQSRETLVAIGMALADSLMAVTLQPAIRQLVASQTGAVRVRIEPSDWSTLQLSPDVDSAFGVRGQIDDDARPAEEGVIASYRALLARGPGAPVTVRGVISRRYTSVSGEQGVAIDPSASANTPVRSAARLLFVAVLVALTGWLMVRARLDLRADEARMRALEG